MEQSLRVVYAFLNREAGQAIKMLLQKAEGLSDEKLEKAKKDISDPRYQKLLSKVSPKAKTFVENFILWKLLNEKSNLDDFLQKHPDFLQSDTDKVVQKIFSKLKDSDTSFDALETLLYPNIKDFKDTDYKESNNPHHKVLEVPNMPPNQKWVLITDEKGNPISECRGEAVAMGHCGVATGGELLSLRDHKNKSHITVDRTSDKGLRQLKFSGNRIFRGNLKKFLPYLPAIKALLMSDEIKEIPDHIMNDISVLDLITENDRDFLKEVLDKKPSLVSRREKDTLLPLYEKMWNDDLNVEDLIESLSI